MTLESTTPVALLFDWGNTLMKVMPGAIGPMADWPEIEVMDGVKTALTHLHQRFPCYVVTNAKDSNAAQVWKALERGGINHYFSGVFTIHDTGLDKSVPEFYIQVARKINASPEQLVMIGDDYSQDILSAHNAGLRTIWLTNDTDAIPGSVVHDHEIHCLTEISFENLTVFPPQLEQCEQWLDEYELPLNLKAHMQSVAAFAYEIARKMKFTGGAVDPVLVHRAAILHDIGKIMGWQINQDHALLGGDILREKGYPALAWIIEVHNVHKILTPDYSLWDWNTKLVYYADKRFTGSTKVDVIIRIKELAARHPENRESLLAALTRITVLEAEINDMLTLT